MRIVATICLPVLLLLAGCGGDAGEQVTNSTVNAAETIQVVDVSILSTSQVMVGTNTMSVAAATNMIASLRDTVDVIAIHGSIKDDVSGRGKSSAIVELTRAGVPLVFVEKDGDYSLREKSGLGGVRTVKVGSDQFAELRRLWTSEKMDSKTSSGPVLETTVGWDGDDGTYDLKRIDIGLFGERVWIIQERGESSDQSGSIGVEFRKKW